MTPLDSPPFIDVCATTNRPFGGVRHSLLVYVLLSFLFSRLDVSGVFIVLRLPQSDKSEKKFLFYERFREEPGIQGSKGHKNCLRLGRLRDPPRP